MDLMQKLTILADSAKYDAACTSSGADRPSVSGGIGRCIVVIDISCNGIAGNE